MSGVSTSKPKPAPNSTRATPVPAVYYALLAEIERWRLQLGIPMWKLDDAAGTQSRYYAKALYADTPSGRMATWVSVQMIVAALFPQGFSITITPQNDGCLTASKHRVAIKFSGARYDFEARQDWMTELSKKAAGRGGRARADKLSPRRRKAIAKQAAKKRWSTPKIVEVVNT
jgi:hypothetical protein